MSLVPGHASVSETWQALDQRGSCCSPTRVDCSHWDMGWTEELCPLGLAPGPIRFHGAGRCTKGFDAFNTLLSAACVLIWELRDFAVHKLSRKKAELHLMGCPTPLSKSLIIHEAANIFLLFWTTKAFKRRVSLSGLKQQRWSCGVVLLTFLCDSPGTTLRLSRPDHRNNSDYTLPVIEIW